jgi:hypothetical protein
MLGEKTVDGNAAEMPPDVSVRASRGRLDVRGAGSAAIRRRARCIP